MKKGFVLIELIISMALLSIILFIGAAGIKTFNQILKDINENEFYYEIMDFICYGRKCSYKADKKGVVEIKKKEEDIDLIFSIDNNKIKELILTSDIQLYTKEYGEKLNIKNIYINEQGYIKPTTLCFRERNNKEKEITIGVGGNNTSFKEKKEGKWINLN